MSDNNSYIDISAADQAKAKTFFDKAASVGNAGQYDFAIEMFLNGLKLDPDSVEAHQALRDIALRRKAGGGKSLGMFGSMKFPTKGKDERQNMNNAERILAHDPGDTGAMVALAEAAHRAGAYDTALWIGPILGRANNELGKPDYSKFEKLRDVYAKLGRYDLAVEICMRMVQMRPEDGDLKNDLKNLTAEAAMVKGKYKESYRKSIRDVEKQSDQLASERDVVSEEYTDKVAREAEQDMKANPNDPSKIGKYVDALRKTGRAADEEKAAEILTVAFEKTRAFRFRQTLIEMRLKQLLGEFRHRQQLVQTAANEEEKKERVGLLKDFVIERAKEEAILFEEVAEQYPIELKWKYEVGKRYQTLERYTDAIPLFQTAVNDPKLRVQASLELGKTFLAADFPDEAADTLASLAETYPAITAGDETAKEIMYWLGRSHEAKGDPTAALKAYSQVVKWDFNFRDTQKRMKDLRNKDKPQ